jgi:putative transcriptional regulator
MSKKKLSKFAAAMLETAEDMHRIGVMDDAAYERITVRHLGVNPMPTARPIKAGEIKKMREGAKLSQAAFGVNPCIETDSRRHSCRSV